DSHKDWTRDKAGPTVRDDNYLTEWDDRDGKDQYPVTSVSWFAADAYCRAYDKRLPTETEWEFAARAGTNTTYWWGDDMDPSRANNSHKATTAVDDPRHMNPWGLYDMLGNVQEWTSSSYVGKYFSGRKADPTGKDRRILRGGSWACTGRRCL